LIADDSGFLFFQSRHKIMLPKANTRLTYDKDKKILELSRPSAKHGFDKRTKKWITFPPSCQTGERHKYLYDRWNFFGS